MLHGKAHVGAFFSHFTDWLIERRSMNGLRVWFIHGIFFIPLE